VNKLLEETKDTERSSLISLVSRSNKYMSDKETQEVNHMICQDCKKGMSQEDGYCHGCFYNKLNGIEPTVPPIEKPIEKCEDCETELVCDESSCHCPNYYCECEVEESTQQEMIDAFAEIEHERWGKWQKYVNSKCVPSADDGIWQIGEEYLHRWNKQINTPYSELSEKEKQSDRDQVMPYFNYFNARISSLISEIEKMRKSEHQPATNEQTEINAYYSRVYFNCALDSVIAKIKERML